MGLRARKNGQGGSGRSEGDDGLGIRPRRTRILERRFEPLRFHWTTDGGRTPPPPALRIVPRLLLPGDQIASCSSASPHLPTTRTRICHVEARMKSEQRAPDLRLHQPTTRHHCGANHRSHRRRFRGRGCGERRDSRDSAAAAEGPPSATHPMLRAAAAPRPSPSATKVPDCWPASFHKVAAADGRVVHLHKRAGVSDRRRCKQRPRLLNAPSAFDNASQSMPETSTSRHPASFLEESPGNGRRFRAPSPPRSARCRECEWSR